MIAKLRMPSTDDLILFETKLVLHRHLRMKTTRRLTEDEHSTVLLFLAVKNPSILIVFFSRYYMMDD